MLFKTFTKHDFPYKIFTVFYIFMALILVVTSIMMTIFTGTIISAANIGDTNTIFTFIIYISILIVIRTIVSGFESYILRKRYGRHSHIIRENFIKSFNFKPFREIENKNVGETLSIFSNDLPSALLFVSYSFFRLTMQSIMVILFLGYMFYIDTVLTLAFLASFPVLIIVQVLVSLPIKKKSEIQSKKVAEFNKVVNDSLQNSTIIAALGLEKKLENRYLTFYDEFIVEFKSYAKTFCVLVLVGIFTAAVPLILIILWASYRTLEGNLYFSDFIVFTSFALSAGTVVINLSQLLGQIQEGLARAKRVDDEIGDLVKIEPKISLVNDNDFAIKVENLNFPGKNEKKIIENISFEIKKGSKTAITGPSGSGKSTLLKLILGLYDGEGVIKISGKVSYVPQDSFLFPESIAKNIAGENLDAEKLRKSAKEAGILEFIDSLEDGFETVLTENADNISGGQKQRIALARAYYTDSDIILFDEATSSLDSVTESEILSDLSKSDKTIVMIAHRESVIDFCDNIISLKKEEN